MDDLECWPSIACDSDPCDSAWLAAAVSDPQAALDALAAEVGADPAQAAMVRELREMIAG